MNDQIKRERRQDALLSALRTAGRPAGVKELLQRAGLHPGNQTEAKRILRELVRDGVATRDGKRYALAEPAAREAVRPGPASRAGTGSGGRSDGVLGTLTRHR